MKRIYIKQLTSIISMVVTFNLFTAATYANDGITPAEETTCDVLTADGVTKGLYGLCVAYCEAQDIFDEMQPVTEAEILVTLEDRQPNERILANYMKRKTESDPEMPCIVPVANAACPCWDNLESFDGAHNTGGAAVATVSLEANYTPGFFAHISERGVQPSYTANALVSAGNGTGNALCGYGRESFRDVKFIVGISEQEANSCMIQLEDAIILYNLK